MNQKCNSVERVKASLKEVGRTKKEEWKFHSSFLFFV